MKKIILLFIVLNLTSTIYGDNNYHKFAGKNAMWNLLTTGRMSYPREWQTKYSIGDTVEFQGQKYLEVISEVDWYRGAIGAIREDTLEKKVYYYFGDYNQEVVLYDFSLNVGDTIFYGSQYGSAESIYFKVVDSIGSVNLNGDLRKKWYLTTSWFNMKDIWIEGIGSVIRFGLMNPLKPDIPTDASSTYFGCFKYENILYFNREITNSEDCPCSRWLVNVPEIFDVSTEIKIYPIPTKDKLNINFGNRVYDFLEIYTCHSELIVKSKINLRENIELNLKKLENGIYFIKFSGKEGVSLKKFVKN